MQVHLRITLTSCVWHPVGHWVVLDVWWNPGTDQGICQSRDQAQCSDTGFNVSAVLQCAALAHGAPSWPGPNSAYQAGWRRWAALPCSVTGASPASWCLLVDMLAWRISLAGEERCGTWDAGSWCQQCCQKQGSETQPAACTSTAICPAPAQLERPGVSPPHWERYRSCCATLNWI